MKTESLAFAEGPKKSKEPREPHDISSAISQIKEGQEETSEQERILIDIQTYLEAAHDIFEDLETKKPKLPDLPEGSDIEVPLDFRELSRQLKSKLARLDKMTSRSFGSKYRLDQSGYRNRRRMEKVKDPVDEYSQWSSTLENQFSNVNSQIKPLRAALVLHRECQELGERYKTITGRRFPVPEKDLQDYIYKLRDEYASQRRALGRNPSKYQERLALKRKGVEMDEILQSLHQINNLFLQSAYTESRYALSWRDKLGYDLSIPIDHLYGQAGINLRLKINQLKKLELDKKEKKEESISPENLAILKEELFTRYILPHLSKVSPDIQAEILSEYNENGTAYFNRYGIEEVSTISRIVHTAMYEKVEDSFKSLGDLLRDGDPVGEAYRLIKQELPKLMEERPLKYDFDDGSRARLESPIMKAVKELPRLKVFMESRVFLDASPEDRERFLEDVKRLISEYLSQGKIIEPIPLVDKLLSHPNPAIALELIDASSYESRSRSNEAILFMFQLFRESTVESEKNILSNMLHRFTNDITKYQDQIIEILPNQDRSVCNLGRNLLMKLAADNMPIPPLLWERMEPYLQNAVEQMQKEEDYKILVPILSEIANGSEAGNRYFANEALMLAIYKNLGKANYMLPDGLLFMKDSKNTNMIIEDYRKYFGMKGIDLPDDEKFQLAFQKGLTITELFSPYKDVRNLFDDKLFQKIYKYPEFEKLLTDLATRVQGLNDPNISGRIYYSILPFLLETAFAIENKENETEFLARSDRIFKYYQKVLEKTKEEKSALGFYAGDSAWDIVKFHPHPTELLLEFPEQAPLLFREDQKGLLNVISSNFNLLIKDKEDMIFLNQLVGRFGGNAPQIITDYTQCLKEGALTLEEKGLVEEFLGKFRVLSPAIINGYREAKASHTEEVFIAGLESIAEHATGQGTPTETQRQSLYYKDVLRAIYQNNSGQWTTFEKNESCKDRSADLQGFKIKERYEIDLLAAGDIKMKQGVELDRKGMTKLEEGIIHISDEFKAASFDPEIVKKKVNGQIEEVFNLFTGSEVLKDLDVKSLTLEQKLFIILSETIYGIPPVEPKEVKRLLFEYEFANFEDIREYIQGTNDRVVTAQNRDYALLCEFHSLFADRIKEINRRLITAGWENSEIAKKMPEYFAQLSKKRGDAARVEKINKLQLGKLGLNDTFLKQMKRVLNKKAGANYSDDQVRQIIARYEGMTSGLTEASTSKKGRTREFAGQLRGQREKTRKALELLDGKKLNPEEFRLGHLDFDQYLDAENAIGKGSYNDEQFASYTLQQFIGLFTEEREFVEGELDKFMTSSGKNRARLNGYISKSAETAHARMVGGVCVSGDNPNRGEKNMWDMENYFQLVLQDTETKRCQGLVLLHHFEENGRKILTASFNPSSTYLYSVDEKALFGGLLKSLEEFATANGFDWIQVSRNKAIRTNRTGGEFEREMDRKIAAVGIIDAFAEARQFSFNPNYNLKEMDVIWEKK